MELSESSTPRCWQETSAAEACPVLTANRGWAATVSGVERWSGHVPAPPPPTPSCSRRQPALPRDLPSGSFSRGSSAGPPESDTFPAFPPPRLWSRPAEQTEHCPYSRGARGSRRGPGVLRSPSRPWSHCSRHTQEVLWVRLARDGPGNRQAIGPPAPRGVGFMSLG